MSIIVSDLVEMQGWSQRSATFEFELLNQDLDLLGLMEINADAPPTIDNNSNRTVKRKLSGLNYHRNQAKEINMLSDRVKAWMVFSDGQRFPLGVFMFADPSTARMTGGDQVDVTLVDQGLMLDQATETTFSLAPGSKVIDALNERFNHRLIRNASIEASATRTKGDEWAVWPAGTSDMDIINDLCAMAGFYSAYFDNSGIPICRSVPNLENLEPLLSYETNTNVYADSIIETNDLLTAPNRYIVVNNGMTDMPVSGFWDIPDTAPHSIVNRRMVVTKVIDSQAVADDAEATNMARAAGLSDTDTYEKANFTAAINPRHDTFDIVGWDGKKYHEQSWSLTCRDGAGQRHELRRVYTEITESVQ